MISYSLLACSDLLIGLVEFLVVWLKLDLRSVTVGPLMGVNPERGHGQ